MRASEEVVVCYWEGSDLVGVLYQNGHSQFYRTTRILKNQVAELQIKLAEISAQQDDH